MIFIKKFFDNNFENNKLKVHFFSKKKTSMSGLKDQNLHKIENVTIFLPPGDKCNLDTDDRFIIAYKLICDPISETPIILNSEMFNPESCFNIIEIKTDTICNNKTHSFRVWWRKIAINKSIIGVIFLVIGFYLTFISDIYRKKSFLITIGISIIYSIKFYISNLNIVYILGKILILKSNQIKKFLFIIYYYNHLITYKKIINFILLIYIFIKIK